MLQVEKLRGYGFFEKSYRELVANGKMSYQDFTNSKVGSPHTVLVDGRYSVWGFLKRNKNKIFKFLKLKKY